MLRLSRVGCSLAVLLLALGIAGVYTVPILTPTAKTSHRSSVTHARSSRATTRTSHVDASLPRFAELHSAAQRPSYSRHHSSHRFQASNTTTTNTTSAPLATGVPDAFTVSNVCWKLGTRQIVVPSTDKRSGHFSFTSGGTFYVWRGCQPSGGACWRTLWSLSMKTLEWTQSGVTSDASEDAMAASYAAYAKYGDIIYDVAGERGSTEGRRPSNIMGALYPSNGRWVYAIVNSSDNIPPVIDASLTVVGTRLYLFGGEGEKERYNTLWSCDISNAPALQCNWEKVNITGTPPEARSGHTATAVGNGFVIFGGQSSSGSLADMWYVNLNNNRWHQMKPQNPNAAPVARAYHSAVHSGGSNKLLIFGGYSSSSAYYGDVKVYDFGVKAWQTMPDSFNAGLTMPALKRLHVTRMGNQVLISGGCGASGSCQNVLSPLLFDMNAVCSGASGPGVCQNGNYTESNKIASCSCNPGFRGKFCESAEICVRNCSNNGVCRDGNCQCNLGFGGADCSKTVCPNACSGNGECSLSLSKCICNVGKWGLDCSQDNCPNNCYGRGVCKEKATPTSENICECLPGYSGKDCGQWAAVNQTTPADPAAQPASMDMILTTSGLTRKQVVNAYDPGFSCTNHCSGHGFCIKQFGLGGSVQGRCQCIPGFGGIDCSGECTVHCSGSQGVCSGVDPLTVQCKCKEGFKGVGCFESYCARNCTSPANGKCDTETNKCGCIYPYSGPACAIDYTCSGKGDFSDGKCKCKPGFGGFNCETAVSCPDNCNGRGDCMGSEPQGDTKTVTGTCVCKEGYTGDRCHIQTCPKDCSGNGKCGTAAKCECYNGWIGTACDMQVKCPNNCTAPHRGQCVPTGTGDEGTCKCAPGWTGPACEMVGCASECYNHGKCVEAQCICDDGYSGKNCEIACPNKCSGRGACISGKCECRPGFGSEDCSQRRVCPGNGTADGECGSLASPSRGVCDWAKGECYCSPGFSSADCSKIDTCGVGCGPNGQCKHGQCFCDPGWKGKHCEEQASCEDNCMNRGLCANGRCYCNTGFNGTKCEIVVEDFTCPKNCSMPNGRPGGLCQYGRCHCLDGHSGEDCNTYTPSKCRANGQTENCDGNGMCVYNKCFCDPGYTGSHCAQRETCKAGCVKGQGVCLLGECKCLPGFTGPDCSQDIVCEGSPTPCGGNGVCVQGTCACFPGYRGRGCEVVTVLADKQCPQNCSNMGVCHMGRCFCVDGHSGSDCSIVTQSSCPSACSGRGLCRFGQCFCKPGFSGRGCEVELSCNAECLLNGVCAHGFCFCAPGWKGKNCNVPLNLHETRRQLERDVEYAVAMSRALAPSTLANVNATVTVTVNGTETSKTVNVADGSFCAGGCNLRGFCINNKCACKSGWMGARCEIPRAGAIGSRCGNNCNGNGYCLFGECTCKIGWGGKYCERKQTFSCPSDCNGRGVCHLGRCVCDIGFEGHACERRSQCKAECVESGFGLCYRGKCVCVKGRTGESCEQTVDVPAAPRFREVAAGSSATLVSPSDGCPSSCAPHGICMNQQCYCKNGFTGADCSLAAVSQDYVAKLTAASNNLLSDSAVTPVSHSLSASTQAAVDGRTWYVVVGAICGFAGGVLAALMGYMWWERYKEQQRAKATQQILKPLLHTLE